MKRSKIEHHIKRGAYSKALEAIEQQDEGAWRDTALLKCLRAMGRSKDALVLADEQFKFLSDSEASKSYNTSERNNLLRSIALVFAEQGLAKKSCEILQELCERNPQVAALQREFAFALTSNHQLDAAEKALLRALEIEPSSARAHAQLARIYCRTGRVDAGYNSYSRAASLKPDNPGYIERLIYWSNYSERTTQQSNYQLTRLWAQRAHPNNQAGTNTWRSANPDRQLNIGFISSDFCNHSQSYFIRPLLRGLSKTDFKLFAYSDVRKGDSVTEIIKGLCDVWRSTAGLPDKALTKQMAEDEIDILVDLNGHSAENRLGVFAKPIAPLQLSWLGYPATTGLKSVNFRITDRIADPVGINDKFFTEELVRLPNGFLCYEAPEPSPDIDPSDSKGLIRLGSFNSLAKFSTLTFDCWAASMHAVPNSTLYLKRQQLSNASAREFIIRQFAERGIDKERLILKTANPKIEQHLQEYNHVDIALDTAPYNGAATTLEALWMGVPVISLSGQTHASRVTASILERLNLGGMAAKDVAEYAQRVKDLSELEDSRVELRKSLRQRLRQSSLMDTNEFGREFGRAMRRKWHEWCQEHSDDSAAKSAGGVG